jgi:hypothetical protein
MDASGSNEKLVFIFRALRLIIGTLLASYKRHKLFVANTAGSKIRLFLKLREPKTRLAPQLDNI